jgi:hypothetical protein
MLPAGGFGVSVEQRQDVGLVELTVLVHGSHRPVIITRNRGG